MKKFLIWMLGLVTMLSSCSEAVDMLIEGNGGQQVTFSLSADGLEQTRATADGLRYVMAIYDETGTNKVVAETVFDQSTFSVRLDQGKYTCLFWADHGSANYDAADLTAITAKDNSADDANAEAFYAKQGITVTDGGTVNVTLSRAVAKVTLNETDRLVAGSITVTYNGFKDFNVSTGNGINSGTLTQTISFANVIEGTVANPTKVGEFLLLANSGENYFSDFKVKYNSEAEKTITNVPVQANYVTNINGKFSVNVSQSFSISINDTWADTNKEVGI